MELGKEVILSVLIAAVDTFKTDPTGASLGVNVFLAVADDIYNWAHDYPQRTQVYAIEHIYGHKNGMGYIHKNKFIFYSDRDCTDKISEAIAFSWWG